MGPPTSNNTLRVARPRASAYLRGEPKRGQTLPEG